jgi:hypothetical protein
MTSDNGVPPENGPDERKSYRENAVNHKGRHGSTRDVHTAAVWHRDRPRAVPQRTGHPRPALAADTSIGARRGGIMSAQAVGIQDVQLVGGVVYVVVALSVLLSRSVRTLPRVSTTSPPAS